MTTPKPIVFIWSVLGLCAAVALPTAAQENPQKTQAPYTYLFDTNASFPTPLPPEALTKRTGWTLVPEEDLAHVFAGDVVLLNDKLTVVLRKSGPGAEVYSTTATGLVQRALLCPCPEAGQSTARLSAVKILENNRTAVMVDAVFSTNAGKNACAGFRLTTGDICVETRTGEGTSALSIRGKIRYVVVPDFFGDDAVWGDEAFGVSRVGLPAENFFLNLLEGGEAIVMCVWQSNEQNADVIFAGSGQKPVINACEVQSSKDKKIWVAFLESGGLWHSRVFSDKDKEKDIALDWTPPFPAKWRASFVREAGVAESWNFRDEKEPESASPGLGKIHPCWFDSGRAFVGIPGVQRADKGEAVTREFVGPVIVYPMDRSPSTPLPVFCPIDIMRNVLGVGPCQYILATEGLGAGEPPTPDNVTRWVEKQFERKRDRRAAGEIKERLDEMTRHIKNMQARIEQYADFATKVRQLCVVEEHNRDISEVARRLRSIMDDAGSDTAARGEATKAPLSAQEWAGAMSALIGKENALDECKRLGAEIQAIGAAQDKTLSKWRMAVRRLKQECRMVAAPPPAADFARKIQDRAEQMLRKRS